MGIESKIRNSHLLTDIFERWPSFHDAEVLSLTLDRGKAGSFSANLQAVIRVYEMALEVDESGKYALKNHVMVTLQFFKVSGINISDFNHQNVVEGLRINDIADQQLEHIKFEVFFDGIFGVSAKFRCQSIDIESVITL